MTLSPHIYPPYTRAHKNPECRGLAHEKKKIDCAYRLQHTSESIASPAKNVSHNLHLSRCLKNTTDSAQLANRSHALHSLSLLSERIYVSSHTGDKLSALCIDSQERQREKERRPRGNENACMYVYVYIRIVLQPLVRAGAGF